MKRIAIPVTNERLSEYFGECHHYEIFEVEGKSIKQSEAVFPRGKTVLELPDWLEEQGITDIISFKVSSEIISLFASRKVNLFIGVPRESPQKLVDAWMEGKLESDENIIHEITNNAF